MPGRESIRLELFTRDLEATAEFLDGIVGFVTSCQESGYRELQLGAVIIGVGAVDALPDGRPLKPQLTEHLGLGIEIVIETDDVDSASVRAQASGASLAAARRASVGTS
jgi:hypothetical protein